MVVVGTATIGEKEIRTDWPIEEGLIAGTTKQEGRQENLVAEEEDLTLSTEKWGSL